MAISLSERSPKIIIINYLRTVQPLENKVFKSQSPDSGWISYCPLWWLKYLAERTAGREVLFGLLQTAQPMGHWLPVLG